MEHSKLTETLLMQHIKGLHLYRLLPTIQLVSVSKSLCEMTGFTEEAFLSGEADRYAELVHPADRENYRNFLLKLAQREQTAEAEYRLVCKNGSVLFVRDTMTVQREEDGSLTGISTLQDITEWKQDQLFNDTFPCGFLKYTCGRQPQITYMNRQMREMLHIPEVQEGEIDYYEMYRNNIFMLVPIEERHRLTLYLNRVYSAGEPLAGDITLLRCDGSRLHIFGWVTKSVNERGEEEFQSVCMDVTERYQIKKLGETRRYVRALTGVFDRIFEYDLANRSVRCLHAQNSPVLEQIREIPMQMEEATERWLISAVTEEDRKEFADFFAAFYQKQLFRSGEKPPQITYHICLPEGGIRCCRGIFLRMDDSVSLYCSKTLSGERPAESLPEQAVFKNDMKEMLQCFTDGIAAFEVTGEGIVSPLYASENVCEYFGYNREEWLNLMENGAPLREFVGRSEASLEDYTELLRTGEAEFSYYDLQTQMTRRIRAICSRQLPGAARRYVMLYNVDSPESIQEKKPSENRTVTVRTFGYFDVFVGEQPIAFRSAKSKELFALLIDRRGGFVSSKEAIGFLWEEEPVNSVTQARYRKVALRLKNTLEEYGISEIVESVDGNRRIVPEKLQCDLYQYLSGKEEYSHLFKGSYLTNYSWGENTLAELTSSAGAADMSGM